MLHKAEGTGESGDNSLLDCRYEQLFLFVDIKILITSALMFMLTYVQDAMQNLNLRLDMIKENCN